MALSRVVAELFDFEKYRDLEIWVRCHSRALKVVPFDTLDMVSYYCSIVTLSLRRRDIRLQKCRDLANRVRGQSRSLKMSPFDRANMTVNMIVLLRTKFHANRTINRGDI